MEASSKMIVFDCWEKSLAFGNLLKSNGINSLVWYTVELSGEIYAFDALAVAEYGGKRTFSFNSEIDASISQVKDLVISAFASFDEFAKWIKENFYIVCVKNLNTRA